MMFRGRKVLYVPNSLHDCQGWYIPSTGASFRAWSRAWTPRPSSAWAGNVLKNGTARTAEDVAPWNAASRAWMKEVLREKFTQNLHLKDRLLREFDGGPGAFAEVTPDDSLWATGCSLDDFLRLLPSSLPGENRLGALLTELRNEWYFVDD